MNDDTNLHGSPCNIIHCPICMDTGVKHLWHGDFPCHACDKCIEGRQPDIIAALLKKATG
jgi:hypothetical protein